MFIIPCKYINGLSKIKECINSIRLIHPEEKIVVVDSKSDNISYLTDIKTIPNVFVCNETNENYVIGALWKAYKQFPNEPYYILIHDTMKIKHRLDEFLLNDQSYSFLYFDEYPPNIWWKNLEHVAYKFLGENYTYVNDKTILGVWGSVGIFKQSLVKKFIKNNLHLTYLPTDKLECQISERVLGILMKFEGIDVTKNCIEQKNCLTYWNEMNGDSFKYMSKIITSRQ
jgi:hypothetical protein